MRLPCSPFCHHNSDFLLLHIEKSGLHLVFCSVHFNQSGSDNMGMLMLRYVLFSDVSHILYILGMMTRTVSGLGEPMPLQVLGQHFRHFITVILPQFLRTRYYTRD